MKKYGIQKKHFLLKYFTLLNSAPSFSTQYLVKYDGFYLDLLYFNVWLTSWVNMAASMEIMGGQTNLKIGTKNDRLINKSVCILECSFKNDFCPT